MINQSNECNLAYTGKVNPPPGAIARRGQPLSPYLPNPELLEMVKLAIALERPLLLMGDPGCGKTKLASAIAYEFTQNNPAILEKLASELSKNERSLPDWAKFKEWPYYPWYVKSTSRARDGLYTYDAVSRLRDTQLVKNEYLDEKERKKLIQNLQDETQSAYIKFGALGKAFQSPLTAIVLIDEIDKADIDFPNDLLLELDEKRFFIEETQREIPGSDILSYPPIVIVTSNNEKDLPNAFLRRCLFHYMEPPSFEELKGILAAHFGEKLPEFLTTSIIETYLDLRKETANKGGKQVSTSELIDWVKALLLSPIEEVPNRLKDLGSVLGILLKTRDEQIRYKKAKDKKNES